MGSLMSDTYAVELTFRQWMDVSHAVGNMSGIYASKGMDGQANQYNAINDEIAGQIAND